MPNVPYQSPEPTMRDLLRNRKVLAALAALVLAVAGAYAADLPLGPIEDLLDAIVDAVAEQPAEAPADLPEAPAGD